MWAKTICRALVLIACVGNPVFVSAQAPGEPTEFVADYVVHHSGARVGTTRVTLERLGDDQYNLSSITHPKGLAAFVRSKPVEEYSQIDWASDGTIKSTDYKFIDGSRKGKRNSTITFDWDAMMASSHYKGQDIQLEIGSAGIDRLALQARLMHDLDLGQLQPSYSVINKNEIKTYNFKILGEELIDTPAGRFETVKILQARDGSSRSTHIWMAREHHFVTVKISQFKEGKVRTVLTATNIDVKQEAAVQSDTASADPASATLPAAVAEE